MKGRRAGWPPLASAVLCAAIAATSTVVAAGEAAVEPVREAAESSSPEALAAFVEGTRLVREAHWARALASFERAAKIKPHPVTTYNIGACERAMGRYTRARAAFVRALEQHGSAPSQGMPESLVTQSRAFLREIDGLLAKVSMTIEPPGALLAVDGRPLERLLGRGRRTLVGGTRPPGTGEPAPPGRFDVLLDPGAHVFTLARKGFANAVLNRTLRSGSHSDLSIHLDLLPATIRVVSPLPASIVRIGGVDVGPAPVDILRPAGSYRVVVSKDGMVPYETEVAVQPGEQVELRAKLRRDVPALTERWWFWTAVGAVVVGAAAGTYFATRSDPEPTRQEVSGGSFGWKVPVP